MGPETILLTCRVVEKDSEVVGFVPTSSDFSSFRCWVRIAELNPLVQSKVLAGHGSSITLSFTFSFEDGYFTGLSAIVDKEKEITCFPSREAVLTSITE